MEGAALVRKMLLPSAVLSIGFMLYRGRNNEHVWLTILFVIWVAAPFAAMWLGMKNESLMARVQNSMATLNRAMTAVAIGSVIVYTYDFFFPPASQPAFMFVIAPGISWMVIGISTAMAVMRRPDRP